MLIDNTPHTTIWYEAEKAEVYIIDQTRLPHEFVIKRLDDLDDFCIAIKDMLVRGAPLIGATAAYGFANALKNDPSCKAEETAASQLLATRPTAVNLQWAIKRIRNLIAEFPENQKAAIALAEAHQIRREDIAMCEAIGEHGMALIKACYEEKQQPVNILTHCNAGWLATVDWGTALAPIYKAHFAGIPVHVWVDETRPRNQGASLTAFELSQQGIPHTVIVDNAGGHLMQHAMVDMCIVGSDRTTSHGDVCNKIGTYLKALAAADNNIPFYVALPTSTIDWELGDGLIGIPIEVRDQEEVTHLSGQNEQGDVTTIRIVVDSPAANYAFDVTPAKYVSALITEHGIVQADKDELAQLKDKLGERK